jgi:hypothetical protein
MTQHHSHPDSRKNRCTPRIEVLEDRCVPTCNFIVNGSTLLIQAPAGRMATNDTIIISDNGGSGPNNVAAFCGASFFPNVPISNIQIIKGNGNDHIIYNLIGDLTTARRLDAILGNGNNTFLAILRRNLNPGANLSLNVLGGAGNDKLEAVMIGSLATNANMNINFDGGGGNNILNVLSATFVNVAAGANLRINLNGDGNNDLVFSDYEGVMNGTYQIRSTGGFGSNKIYQDIELAPGSTGTVLPSSVVGGPGHDRLSFFVHNPGTASSNQLFINGLSGFNRCVRTVNVAVFNCDTDLVVI